MRITPAIFLAFCFSATIGLTGCSAGGETGVSSPGGGTGGGGNTAPVADAGRAQSAALGKLVTLDGSNSTDANGDLLNYRWSFVSKPGSSSAIMSNPTVVRPTFTADAVGEYVVQLVVNDDRATSTPATITVTAGVGNLRPVANAGPPQNVPAEVDGVMITLHGENSTDGNGDRLTYVWAFDKYPGSDQNPKPLPPSLSNSATANPTFNAKPGNYTVTLQVSDGTLLSPPNAVVVKADGGPTAVPDPSCLLKPTDCLRLVELNKDQPTTVPLDGSKSSDPNGDAFTYTWDITTKPDVSTPTLEPKTAANPTFTTTVAGRYVVQLQVTDGSHPPNIKTMEIFVVSDPTPVITLTPTSGKVLPNQTVTLTGETVPKVPAGTPHTFNWTVTRAGSSEPTFSSTDAIATFQPITPGDYTVSLTVTLGEQDPSPPATPQIIHVKSVIANGGISNISDISVCSTVTLRAQASDPSHQLTWTLPGSATPSSSPASFFVSDIPGGGYVATVTNTITSETDTVTLNVDAVDRDPKEQGTVGHRFYHYGPDNEDNGISDSHLDCEECHSASPHDQNTTVNRDLTGKLEPAIRERILPSNVGHTGGKFADSLEVTCRIKQLVNFLGNLNSVPSSGH